MVIQYVDQNISMRNLLHQMKLKGTFDFKSLGPSKAHSCETKGCAGAGKSNKARMEGSSCYCDDQCHTLGDCCYDYYLRYIRYLPPKRLNSSLTNKC